MDCASILRPQVRPSCSRYSARDATDIEAHDVEGQPVALVATQATDGPSTPLFSTDEAKGFRDRWDAIQGAFVDEPHQAVELADSLVAAAMKRLEEVFADERANLEGQWARDQSISTEDLRLALRRYRSFFGRLLAV
jgi:hypothetical protein